MARQANRHAPKRWSGLTTGYTAAVEAAVKVTVAVLLVESAPTEHVTPASPLEALQVKVGLPAKLLMGVRVSVDVPLEPGLIDTLLGEPASEKSAGMVAKLNTPDHGPFSPLPEDASACTSH